MQGRARAGWQDKETERLFQAVDQAAREGQPLRHVFESLSGELGRKPNSIRNYYYARLRQHPESSVQRAAPFQTFTQEEVRALLRQVLMARGQGKSVRSCVMDMAQGDHSRMLRYQNKYRTVLRRCPSLVEEVSQELRAEGLPCPELEDHQEELIQPDNVAMANLLAEPAVHAMLEGLKELLRRASRETDAPALQRQVDRMAVQQDLRRLSLRGSHGDRLPARGGGRRRRSGHEPCENCKQRTANGTTSQSHRSRLPCFTVSTRAREYNSAGQKYCNSFAGKSSKEKNFPLRVLTEGASVLY